MSSSDSDSDHDAGYRTVNPKPLPAEMEDISTREWPRCRLGDPNVCTPGQYMRGLAAPYSVQR